MPPLVVTDTAPHAVMSATRRSGRRCHVNYPPLEPSGTNTADSFVTFEYALPPVTTQSLNTVETLDNTGSSCTSSGNDCGIELPARQDLCCSENTTISKENIAATVPVSTSCQDATSHRKALGPRLMAQEVMRFPACFQLSPASAIPVLSASSVTMHVHSRGLLIVPNAEDTRHYFNHDDGIILPLTPFTLVTVHEDNLFKTLDNPLVVGDNRGPHALAVNTVSDVFAFTLQSPPPNPTVLLGSSQLSVVERSVAIIAAAIRVLTQSLFPVHCSPRFLPLTNVPATRNRLLSGYLLRQEENTQEITLQYCDLLSHEEGRHFTVRVYSSERCHNHVYDIDIGRGSTWCELQGYNCSVFRIHRQYFAGRTVQDRTMWTKCLTNLKQRLLCNAPPPDDSTMNVYRAEIANFAKTLSSPFDVYNHLAPMLEIKFRTATT
eukprot:GHVQ01004684.1.p1 GENE.GHVQ01004684.1~~GHVQ01004684.1.p1  ORF type:complete len:435 (-),score=36.80 GHVQ01004684.1:69-1373(-)